MSDEGFLRLTGLALGYGTANVVDGLDLSVRRGELVALLGPSGCGKTTTMRAIAGLLDARSGRIELDGRDITRVPANRRDVGLVFQSYALFPHLSAFENVAFGLRLRRVARGEIARRVEAALTSVGLTGFGARLPRELSGGQQQRVALARAMVVAPRLLLLDEPLSNLDARLRLEMRGELQRLQRELGIAMLYVTHDQAEALALADRIVVMRAGRIEQIDDAETIYARPRTGFVARFMGFENVFAVKAGRLSGDAGGDLPAPPGAPQAGALAWRPDGVVLGAGPHRGRVRAASFGGAQVEYLLDTALGPVKAELPARAPRHTTGSEIAFDLPLATAAALEGL
jgi:putative spermidine/putrescine transport system ATP-binding protein